MLPHKMWKWSFTESFPSNKRLGPNQKNSNLWVQCSWLNKPYYFSMNKSIICNSSIVWWKLWKWTGSLELGSWHHLNQELISQLSLFLEVGVEWFSDRLFPCSLPYNQSMFSSTCFYRVLEMGLALVAVSCSPPYLFRGQLLNNLQTLFSNWSLGMEIKM